VGTFIEIQTDAFAGNMVIAKESADYSGVRRPYRGIEIKEDTYGIIKVIKDDGTELPLVDAGGRIKAQSSVNNSDQTTSSSTQRRTGLASTYNYSNFIIQRLAESRQEKSQILETFGDTYIFFFGERPRIINVTGLLMNTLDFNWRAEFWHNYENTLRGTKLVEQNARIYLYWDDVVIEGYVLQATAQDDANMPYHIPFSMQIFVTNHMFLSTVGEEDYPITSAVNLQPLLQGQFTMSTKRALKANVVASKKYVSTTKEVRKAQQASEASRQQALSANALSSTGQKLLQGKNILANALMIGMNAQNMTFLSLVNHQFRDRKMRFPKGIAGSEAMAPAKPSSYPPEPKQMRVTPLRTKIRDNVDEYVQGKTPTAVLDQDAISRAKLAKASKNIYTLEKKALADLAKAGIDPVQHPGGSPFGASHGMTAVGKTLTQAAMVAFALGAARGIAELRGE
jgi:hypothetical protein